MNIAKATRRDRKHQRRNRHLTDSRSVFIIQEELKKKAIQIKKEREAKEETRQQ